MATLSTARQRLLEVEALEHEADLVRAQPGQLVVRGAARSRRPATVTAPRLARSSVPSTVSIVVLPEPDGPTTATRSPRRTSTLTSAQRVDPAGVLLAHVPQAEHSSLRVGDRQALADAAARRSGRSPAANRPGVTGIRWWGAAAGWTA